MKKLLLLFITTSFVLPHTGQENIVWSVDEKYENGNIKTLTYHSHLVPQNKTEITGKKTYYENGQKQTEGTLKDGELISSKCWDEDGNEKECG